MIKTDKEYKLTLGLIKDNYEYIESYKLILSQQGINEEDTKRVLEPLVTNCIGLLEEAYYYDAIKRLENNTKYTDLFKGLTILTKVEAEIYEGYLKKVLTI